jgi:hypothetical protein
MLATDQLGKIAPLLFRRAPAADLVDAKVGVGAVGQAHGGRGAGDFLHGHHMFQIAQAEAAPFFLDGNAVQAKVAHLRPELTRKAVGLVDVGGDRRDLGGGEPGRGVPKGVDSFSKAKVQAGHLSLLPPKEAGSLAFAGRNGNR